ncbi:hypothetical protein CU102_26590 [Phyllobacterium brassicacearum]|uniref:Uncharacterized protein n=1 Tax=Phyllobacterium brassicacearum TaxID=314235 RepID=A0A2P7B5J0_9HYPH|nr:hypothetical protein CU102_26590 [Phyllobacterium brassicacearum]
MLTTKRPANTDAIGGTQKASRNRSEADQMELDRSGELSAETHRQPSFLAKASATADFPMLDEPPMRIPLRLVSICLLN